MKPEFKSSILIVDDQLTNLQLLATMLNADGCQVRPAKTGKLALKAALHSPPDLILLDIKMPEMDGFAVCSLLKAHAQLKDIPVLFISASSEIKEKLAAFQAGGVDYITKPFQEREVLARVRTQLQLNHQKKQMQANLTKLKHLESLRDSLTHMLVHDMRTPLMTLDGYLHMMELFEASMISEAGKSYIRSSRQITARLKRMTSEMLLVSKLESGKLILHPAPCDLVAVAREVMANLAAAEPGHALQFVTNVKTACQLVDRELISRVMENLIGNALKFHQPESAVMINLQAGKTKLRFEVADDGPGIPPEDQPKIFDKFNHVTTPGNRDGIGLGLAFCKLAVEAHGGRIGVTSQLAQGSIFWFEFNTQEAPLERHFEKPAELGT